MYIYRYIGVYISIVLIYVHIFSHMYHVYILSYVFLPKTTAALRLLAALVEDVRGPKIPKISHPMFRTKISHTSGTIFENVRKNVEKCFQTMLPYRVQ